MTSQKTIEFSLSITSSGAWTQVNDQETAAPYVVSASSRCDVRDITLMNLGANAAAVQYAISASSPSGSADIKLSPITVPAGGHYEGSRQHTLHAGFSLWAKATGTSPDVTVSAQGLEISGVIP